MSSSVSSGKTGNDGEGRFSVEGIKYSTSFFVSAMKANIDRDRGWTLETASEAQKRSNRVSQGYLEMAVA